MDGGASLTRPPEQITLLDVYRGIEPGDLLALHHRRPNLLCRCGRNIQPVLIATFKKAEAVLEATLAETSIADVVQAIKAREQANYL